MSCPADFDQHNVSCIARCPAGFKYAQSTGSPRQDQCVLFTDNSKTFSLNSLPTSSELSTFETERTRVSAAAAAIQSMAPYEDNAKSVVDQVSQIKSQYAGFQAETDSGAHIKEVSDSIQRARPVVAPIDIDTVRQQILNPSNMDVIQTALFTILLAFVVLLVLPFDYAQGPVLLVLCVGMAAGIYLSNR